MLTGSVFLSKTFEPLKATLYYLFRQDSTHTNVLHFRSDEIEGEQDEDAAAW